MDTEPESCQRLSIERLHAWQALRYGMFFHFGMSTFDGQELSMGSEPPTVYAPDRLDVDQWICVARDAGMQYAVLTAKHVSGFALWPTRYSDYHVGCSGNSTDVVKAFVTACERHGVRPGLYYCSWDNRHLLGSQSPASAGSNAFTTQEYREFQANQIEELLTQYGDIMEVWIDIPNLLGQDGRNKQYEQIVRLQPDATVVMNAGFTHGANLDTAYCWPTDILSIERGLPCAPNRKFGGIGGYSPWWQVDCGTGEKGEYYVPGEVCDTIGWEWFYQDDDLPRSDAELLGMFLVSRERRCNFLLNVPPDRHGVIPRASVEALQRLRRNLDRF